jgi:hypothetical protein
MLFYVDESGDYGFPPDRFDCYVLVALICPERVLPTVIEYLGSIRTTLDVGELHGSEMSASDLLKIAEFVATQPLRAAVNITDTQLLNHEGIQRWRRVQMESLAEGLEATRAHGNDYPELTRVVERYLGRAGYRSRISDSEFVQASQIPGLLFNAFNRAAQAFSSQEWEAEFGDFRFVIDAKGVDKLSPGEKYVRDICPLVWASQPPGAMLLPDRWRQNPTNPFRRKYEEHEGIRISRIFEHGIEFEPSHLDPGLQLADVLAHTIRRAVLDPGNGIVRRAYDALRPTIAGPAGRCFLMVGKLSRHQEIRLMLGEPGPERYNDLYLCPGAPRDSMPGVQTARGMYRGVLPP